MNENFHADINEYLPLRDVVFQTLRKAILKGELKPGERLMEIQLANKLGVSRTPVREALIELSRVGIVRIVPQKRGTVAPIDYRLIDQAGFMRSVLECAVVELACEMATAESLARLSENIQLQNLYLENGNYAALMALDDQFHEMLFEIAQKAQIYFMVQTTFIHFNRVRRMALGSVKDLKIVQDHARILEAIRRRDAAEAKRLMEIHLSRYKEDAQQIRAAFPQYMDAQGEQEYKEALS